MVLKGKQTFKNYCVEWKLHTDTCAHCSSYSINRRRNNAWQCVQYRHNNMFLLTQSGAYNRALWKSGRAKTSLFVCYLRLLNQLFEIVLLDRTPRLWVSIFRVSYVYAAMITTKKRNFSTPISSCFDDDDDDVLIKLPKIKHLYLWRSEKKWNNQNLNSLSFLYVKRFC